MPYAACMDFNGLFDGADDETDAFLSLRTVIHLCECLYKCNVEFLLSKLGEDVPNLYDTGVFYKTPSIRGFDGDVWQNIPRTRARGSGDCKDLACWLAAERTVRQGLHCVPFVKRRWYHDGFALYHVVVRHPDNCVCGECDGDKIEDPSALLGMPLGDGA